MKKALALLLALVMCLSLAACGVDEKYTALLENLDSNNYDGIKQELSALSPDFAAEQEQMKADAETLAKYADLIAALEAEDYVTAVADIVSRAPAPEGTTPEEPTYSEVKVTMDNWQDYFELREYESHQYNAFGEETSSRLGYGIYLKEEYLGALKDNGADVGFKVALSVEYREYDREAQQFVVDGEFLSAERMEYYDLPAEEEVVEQVWDNRYITDSSTDVSTGNGQVCAYFVSGTGFGNGQKEYQSIYVDISVIDVTGTLLLTD